MAAEPHRRRPPDRTRCRSAVSLQGCVRVAGAPTATTNDAAALDGATTFIAASLVQPTAACPSRARRESPEHQRPRRMARRHLIGQQCPSLAAASGTTQRCGSPPRPAASGQSTKGDDGSRAAAPTPRPATCRTTVAHADLTSMPRPHAVLITVTDAGASRTTPTADLEPSIEPEHGRGSTEAEADAGRGAGTSNKDQDAVGPVQRRPRSRALDDEVSHRELAIRLRRQNRRPLGSSPRRIFAWLAYRSAYAGQF